MANAAEIADLLTRALQSPIGAEDIGLHTGVVLAWDEISQTNSVLVNNAAISNMKTVQSGIGTRYAQGDAVMVMRKQTQYFVLGKISAPGGNNANQIQGQFVAASESTASTSKTSLTTPGPVVTLNIGSSGRALVMVGAYMQSSAAANAGYYGGAVYVDISGSTVQTNAVQLIKNQYAQSSATGFSETGSAVQLVTGLNPGSTTFTCFYSAGPAVISTTFASRTLTVIPF